MPAATSGAASADECDSNTLSTTTTSTPNTTATNTSHDVALKNGNVLPARSSWGPALPAKALIVNANARHAGTHSSRPPYPPSGHDSVISQPVSPKAASYTHSQHSRCSNTSRDARHGPGFAAQTLDGRASNDHPSVSPSPAMPLDLEKQAASNDNGGRRWTNSLQLGSRSCPVPDEDALVDDELKLEEHALRILQQLHLSGFCCAMSFLITLWTLLALVLAALLQPLRFCSMRPDYREQVVKFLAPPLKLQLRMVYAHPLSTMYNTPLLVLVHLLSPFLAMGVALASWTAACFWIYALIIGDPGSRDGHNDGRESVLTVRSWWESWLLRALR
ncbi:hypothetical protein K490DRAFT_54680 [Saccharata proteae CBS 121410]|uniref:Uncharacterized protein n=1 Tax=Saccharata proteae CBS 121410 TaxID=1314787 RepID=A0A9P4I138_9PEZI|nr:hypothetical protein K490DRAFT_54680 [Saccharata proteae CBS 121410]